MHIQRDPLSHLFAPHDRIVPSGPPVGGRRSPETAVTSAGRGAAVANAAASSRLGRWIAAALPQRPYPFVKQLVGLVAQRYIAGETENDAIQELRRLNALGARATVDVLGEFIHDMDEAHATAQSYHSLVARISNEGLDSNVSAKLTAFGLDLDMRGCVRLVRKLAEDVERNRSFLRIDMENSPYTDRTLQLVHMLHSEGLPVGAVLQASLHRTLEDAKKLADAGVSVRLCKGIYRESPDIAYQGRDEIRESYLRTLDVLLAGTGRVAFATHDDILINEVFDRLSSGRADPERTEFQMLLGVRESTRDMLIEAGHPVRIYVPFGASWYPYSVRRLKENPELAMHVFRSVIGQDST